MVADIILVLWNTIPASVAIIGYAAGANVMYCGLFNFAYHPVSVYHITFVMISIDKVVAISCPFNYKQIITSRVIKALVIISWLLAITTSLHTLFIANGSQFPGYGMCIFTGINFLPIILPYALAIFTEFLVTTTLNIYLTMKTYKFNKQILKQTSTLTVATNQVEALQQKLQRIRKHMKPIRTLLVIFIANSFLSLIFISLYIQQRSQDDAVFRKIVDDMILPNLVFFNPFLHPLIYGLYFKQIRQPMIQKIKQCYNRCKQNGIQ